MSIVIEEEALSREQQEGDGRYVDRRYVIFADGLDWGQDAKIRRALQTYAPETIDMNEGTGNAPFTVYRQHVYISPEGGYPVETWRGVCRYGDLSIALVPTGLGEFTFDTSGGTEHIVQAKQHIADYPSTANFHGVIGYNKVTKAIAGIDLPVKAFPFSKTKYVSVTALTSNYLDTLEALTKCYNDRVFTVLQATVYRTYQLGEVLLDRVTCSYTQGDAYIAFRFEFLVQRTRTNFQVGGITVATKLGWDLMTVDHKDTVESNEYTKIVEAVHVDRVFDPGNFDLLGIEN